MTLAVRLIGTLLLAWNAGAIAQDAYPAKPVTIVVPYAPGGAVDVVIRPFADALGKDLRQSIVIVNRAGASGAIGTKAAATATADGYTLLAAYVQMSVLPEVDRMYGRPPAYELDQLAGIARLTAEPAVLVTSTGKPWQTLKGLLEDAKRRPGAITYSTGGAYAGNHLPVALLAQAVGVSLTAVPYKGGGPSTLAVLAGEVDFSMQQAGPSEVQVRAGKLRALSQSGPKRAKAFPDLPTFRELGYPVEFLAWTGLFAQRDVPKPVLAALQAAVGRVMRNAEFLQTADKLNLEPDYLGGEEFIRWWESDARSLTEVVRKIGKFD